MKYRLIAGVGFLACAAELVGAGWTTPPPASVAVTESYLVKASHSAYTTGLGVYIYKNGALVASNGSGGPPPGQSLSVTATYSNPGDSSPQTIVYRGVAYTNEAGTVWDNEKTTVVQTPTVAVTSITTDIGSVIRPGNVFRPRVSASTSHFGLGSIHIYSGPPDADYQSLTNAQAFVGASGLSATVDGNPITAGPDGTVYTFYGRTETGSPKYYSAAYGPVAFTVQGVNSSTYVSQSVPATVEWGRTFTVTQTWTNSGSKTWTSGGNYKLGSQNPQDNLTWGTGRFAYAGSVAPGGTQSYTWTSTAPSTPGTYNFQTRWVQESVEWFGAYSPNVVVTVTKRNQSISFPNPGNRTYGDPPFQLSASASSGLPVTYSISGPATLSGNTVTITGAGTISITALQGGDALWNAAPNQSCSVFVAQRGITVTRSGSKAYDGNTVSYNAGASITQGNLVYGDAVSYSFGNTSSANAGSYVIPVSATVMNGGSNRTASYAVAVIGSYAISVAPPASVTVSPSSQTITAGDTISFTAGGGSGVGAFVWGGEASGTGPSRSVTFGSAGAKTVTVYRASDGNYSQSNTAVANITVNAVQPLVTISPSAQTITAGQSVTFSASGGAGTGAYVWGGDASGTGSSKTVTFPTAGTRTVTVYRAASPGYSQSASSSATITVNLDQPTVAISPVAQTVTLGDTIAFTASGGAGSGGFYWGGDASGTGATKSVTFSVAGARTVSVYRAASSGYNQSSAAFASIMVNVNQPAPSISPSNSTVTIGNTVVFTATGGSGGGAFVWGGEASGNGATKSVTFNVAGTKTVSVYRAASTGYNQSPTASASITVNHDQSVVIISPPTPTVTKGDTVTFTASGGQGTGALTWGGLASGTGATKNVTFDEVGTGTVTVFRAASAGYNQSNTASATITVNQNQPQVTLSPPSQTVTVGQSITFTAAGGAGTGDYTWGGAASGTGTSKSITFGSSGDKTVTVQRAGSSGYNASNTASVTITVNEEQAAVAISPSTQTITMNQSISFSASGGSGTGAYTWGGEASGTGPSKSVTFASPGTKTVSLFRAASSGFNQSSTATATITVNQNQASVSISPVTQSVALGQSVTFSASGGSGTGTFSWGGVASGTGVSKTVGFTSVGLKSVSVFREPSEFFNQSNTAVSSITVIETVSTSLSMGSISAPTYSAANQSISVSATVAGSTTPNAGSVTFVLKNSDGVDLASSTASVSNGVASGTISIPAGTPMGTGYYVSARYGQTSSGYYTWTDSSSTSGTFAIFPAPAVPSGLRAWYRADFGVTVDALGVSQWMDASGNGFDFGQTDPARRPIWVGNAINGRPLVDFTDGERLKTSIANLHAGGNDLTVIIVAESARSQSTSNASMLDLDADSQRGFSVRQQSGVNNRFVLRWQNQAESLWQGMASPLDSPAAPQIATFVKGGSTQRVWLNGLLASTETVDAYMRKPSAVLAVGGSVVQTSDYYNGRIAEVLIYNRALSDSERAIVISELGTRYALTDSDFDGLPDGWELGHFGSLDATASGDFDFDGLSNMQEYQIGTIASSADSDGDGIPDADEIANGTDPLVVNGGTLTGGYSLVLRITRSGGTSFFGVNTGNWQISPAPTP